MVLIQQQKFDLNKLSEETQKNRREMTDWILWLGWSINNDDDGGDEEIYWLSDWVTDW